MKIVVDGMGGDNAPVEIVKGVVDAVKETGIKIIIVGNEEIINKELNKYDYPKGSINVHHAQEVISNEDDPVLAIRRKKDSSMVQGLRLVAQDKADGFLSAGNTGALLAGGLFIVKRIEGIERAALSTVYPTLNGMSLLLDAGANVDCKPEYIKQFALMGSIYMENVLNIPNPKVGLVNIGVEETKGNQQAKDSYNLLKSTQLNFVGNVEGRELSQGAADVIVCDGFVGNVILKTTEGVAMSVFQQLKEVLISNLKTKIGTLFIKEDLKQLKSKLDYREYGGAPLLGTRKPIVKAHGSSDAYAIKNAIKQLISFIEKDVVSIVEEHLL